MATRPTGQRNDSTDAASSRFVDAVRRAIDDRRLVDVVLSKPRSAAADGPLGVRVRAIELRGAPTLSFVSRFATRDETRNVALPAAFDVLGGEVAADGGRFADATLHATDGDLQLRTSRKGRQTLQRLGREAAAAPPTVDAAGHDRRKARRLPLELPFLVELGVTDASHALIPSMARKWRQCERFLEVIDHALDAIEASAANGERALRVVDFGAGRGTLTFAVHEHLRRRFGRAPIVTGVERRAELVDAANAVAGRCAIDGLRFVVGDIGSHDPGPLDVVIALHACDTATDQALDVGVAAGADVLVCSPCCHRELRPQLARPPALAGLLRHGIHLGQEAEMLTDSLRALLLEASGYEARVFEFVALEHTQKNKMILATRRADGGGRERARAEIGELKRFYGIREQALETLIARRAGAGVVDRVVTASDTERS